MQVLFIGWLALFLACSSLHAAELQKLTVAFVAPSEIMAIPWIARETGIYRKHGFEADVVMITGTPRLVQALVAGNFEYAIVGVSALMRARMGGADPVILAATSDTSRQRIVAGPGTGIHRLQDLKGKTIGVTQYGSEGDNFLRAALKSAGLQPGSDVTIFQTGGNPQTVVALLAGKLQAASMGRSTALAAEQKGAKELLNGHQLNFLSPSGTLATTTRNIQRDPNTVLRFMSAYVEGIHYFKNNRERSIRIMQKYMGGLSESSVAALYDEVKDVYRPLPFVSDEAMQTVLDRETDPKAKGYKPGDFIDMSYLRKIEKSGLVAKLYGNK